MRAGGAAGKRRRTDAATKGAGHRSAPFVIGRYRVMPWRIQVWAAQSRL
ncbi:hypothetical protein HNR13_003874 [Leifsonia shinshuensis]|uniref:Uncharacterized protein n=1 Tax=Leifsonia shinshuensis TaxID=150026 RepID=A0A853CYC3_9MICO|nr:hypothetical protein [Leifsonia shinshuensis]